MLMMMMVMMMNELGFSSVVMLAQIFGMGLNVIVIDTTTAAKYLRIQTANSKHHNRKQTKPFLLRRDQHRHVDLVDDERASERKRPTSQPAHTHTRTMSKYDEIKALISLSRLFSCTTILLAFVLFCFRFAFASMYIIYSSSPDRSDHHHHRHHRLCWGCGDRNRTGMCAHCSTQ